MDVTEDTGERNEDARENKHFFFTVSILCKLKEQVLCLTVSVCLLELFPACFWWACWLDLDATQVKLIWFGSSLVS